MIANDDLGNLGRLGNQMFQYASLRGLAHKHGYEYCLPPREIIGTIDQNCKESDITLFECFKIPEVSKRITNFPKIMESTFALDQNLWERCPDNISLLGYFQTEKYFKHIEDDIRRSFIFVDEILHPTRDAFKSNFGEIDVVSVHVRRGDYLNNSSHPVQSLNYYEKALSYFEKEIPVMIFSDNIDWCKDQKIFEGDRFIFSEDNNTAVDLCLQSLCTYHVIANSSFSWWGAWLAKSKKVIAPKEWFSGDLIKNDTRDIYLDSWVVI